MAPRLWPGSSQNLSGTGGCGPGISFYSELENKKVVAGSPALVRIWIIVGFFVSKNAGCQGAPPDQGSAGKLRGALWDAGSSSSVQMMDVMGLCEGRSQMPAAFLVLAGKYVTAEMLAFTGACVLSLRDNHVPAWSETPSLCAPEKGVCSLSQQLPC